MIDTPRTDARLRREQHLHGAAAQRCSWWRALNRQIRADAFDDLGNSIERYLLHPPLARLAQRARRPPDFDYREAVENLQNIARRIGEGASEPYEVTETEQRLLDELREWFEAPDHGDGSAPPLPLRHPPHRRARFLAAGATKVENLRNIVRRYLEPAEPPDDGAETELTGALDELIEWYLWPADEYGTCDGFTDPPQVRRRGSCVDVTGYTSVMYFDLPAERWDDSPAALLKGYREAYLERRFSAELRYEGPSVVRLAAASEEVPYSLCEYVAPALVGDFVGRCAREIRF